MTTGLLIWKSIVTPRGAVLDAQKVLKLFEIFILKDTTMKKRFKQVKSLNTYKSFGHRLPWPKPFCFINIRLSFKIYEKMGKRYFFVKKNSQDL